MHPTTTTLAVTLAFGSISAFMAPAFAKDGFTKDSDDKRRIERRQDRGHSVQLGPRPFYLVSGMDESALKRELQNCADGPFRRSDFSIGHRGAALQFPEHTRESYEAASRMGAGILECDVTFTKDRELVCRHSQCDLHTTTDILAIPELAAKCSVPFQPAVIDPLTGATLVPARAQCCTSDITLEEFKRLKGKMDAYDPNATTVEAYLNATPRWRTDLYTGRGTLLTHRESIELFQQLGVKMTPELKLPSVAMPFDGDFTQEAYAQKMIDEYRDAGVRPRDVYAQSFNLDDVLYWLANEPAFGRQAVFLDDIDPTDADPDNDLPPTLVELQDLAARGVNIIAPPMWALLALDAQNRIVPSQYAMDAKAAGLDLITWTLERSDLTAGAVDAAGRATWYYQTIGDAVQTDSDLYTALDVLTQDVGIRGIFSDWPATVTFYANCKGLK